MDDNLLSKRNYRIDLLKAVAILEVILYHSGNLSNRYLGVEVFLVVAGYFLMRSYLKVKDKKSFQIMATDIDGVFCKSCGWLFYNVTR